MRDTFLKVGQSLIVKKQLGAEKDLKEKMIHSVMPLKVADWLMTGHSEDNDDEKPGIPLNAVTTANAEDHVAKNDNSDEESNRYLQGVRKWKVVFFKLLNILTGSDAF